jgi:hypothetical protein
MMLACLFLIAFIPFTIKATESSFAKASSDRTADRLPSELPAEVSTPPSITINNNIKPDMLTYKHWTGKYNPDSFKVFVNHTEVSQGNSLQLSSETKTVNLKFDYSFVNGKRTGSKTVSYKLNEDITQANITFSWDNDNKIIIDNGTAIAS